MYTTSSVFLKTLTDAGVTHAFVNWGSDHPGFLEDLERQRVESRSGETAPKIVTCPNEMVALSAAQGYAQVTGKPAAVIIHVDVGTQALAGAVHNVDRGRTPVLIYAGASPFTSEGELKGSRNEWIMWIQDIPDQTAIVRQYMRFTAQINSGISASQVIKRGLQIATSEPKGPVYIWARREIMDEEVSPSLMSNPPDFHKWPAIEPSALSPSATSIIASALIAAQAPLIITSHIGRNTSALVPLLSLSNLLAIPIFSSCPSAVNAPFSHPLYLGASFISPGTHTPLLPIADVVLIIESDVPYIPSHGPSSRPNANARVFVLDGGDPVKTSMGAWHVGAELVCRADAEVALGQVLEAVQREQGSGVGTSDLIQERGTRIAAMHEDRVRRLDEAEKALLSPGPLTEYTVPNILGALRRAIQSRDTAAGLGTLVLNEGITNYGLVWEHMRNEVPGSMITSGGSSLGWALGAAVGAVIGGRVKGKGKGYDLIVAIVGDGSFMFGVPSSAYWIARKYNTPFLTVVLNNGGWKAPKLSMLGVYPAGHGNSAPSGQQLTVGFGPDSPDYAQIAVAASAGWAWGARVGGPGQSGEAQNKLEEVLREAVRIVTEEDRCAVVDCVLESI